MKTQFLVVSKVKKFYHDHGKRIDKTALHALDCAVEQLMFRSIRSANSHKTVRGREVAYAYRQTV